LNPGSQAVQSIHSLHEFEKQQKSQYEHWYKHSKTIVFLSVESINDLQSLKDKLDLDKICYAKFLEPDLNNAITALCIVGGEKTRKLCSKLPLGLSEFSKERSVQNA
jgi:hypothetical protein